jgi:ubiquinone/menaquinone biosynthesis C-methylase UbiE
MTVSKKTISRVYRSKEDAKASYDKMSRWYDLFASFENAYRNAGLRMLGAKQGERVLEIGFGTGHSIVALAHSVAASGRVYGIDLSEGMRRVAQARTTQAGLADSVHLQCGDARNLPFDNDFFDAIFMSFTLELFDTPEIPIVLRESQRVLRDGGRVGVVSMSWKRQPGLIVRLYVWMHEKFLSYVDCRPILVQDVLQDAGFRIANAIEISMWGLPVEIVLARKQRGGE